MVGSDFYRRDDYSYSKKKEHGLRQRQTQERKTGVCYLRVGQLPPLAQDCWLVKFSLIETTQGLEPELII